MANNRMTEGVGKKIVEALKMQTDVEIEPISASLTEPVEETVSETVIDNEIDFEIPEITSSKEESSEIVSQISDEEQSDDEVIPAFDIPAQAHTAQAETDDFEMPTNVNVLKQLISKLPAGVTKQTGAVIIRQTMEALGISMKSVLQEAQMVQEGLNNSARECQASILDYKKQISLMEKQAQKYQRQYAALNDIISLFVNI